MARGLRAGEVPAWNLVANKVEKLSQGPVAEDFVILGFMILWVLLVFWVLLGWQE